MNEINKNKLIKKINNSYLFNNDDEFYHINKYNDQKIVPKIQSYIENTKYIHKPFEKCFIMPVNPMDEVIDAKEKIIYEINNL